jgi:DNA polymerase bacteriophage-type
MSTLYLDIETYSPTPIKHGTYRYAEDAEVLMVQFAFDDDPVTVWDLTDTAKGDWRWKCELQDMIDRADTVVAHNSTFERIVLAAQGVHIPVEKIDDTMVVALMHSLPASLGMLCDVLGVPSDKAKDKEGRKLIQLFCSSCPKNWKIERATRETHPTEWEAFKRYAELDVVAMRDVRARLPRWNDTPAERALWLLDQRANDDGVAVDSDLARAAIRAFERASRSLAARIADLTGGEVTSATQRQKMIDYLRDVEGMQIADLTKGTLDNLLKTDLPPRTRELLEIRRQAASTTPAKYQVLLDAACSDGRLRGLIQFCGASRTGRGSGRIFQPQNLMRPTMSNEQIEIGIAAMKADCEDLLFDNVSELCGSAARGALVAPQGKKLVIADLSNIEGRVAAWLANEEWKLQAFRDFDAGTGHDLYVLAYAKSFGLTPEVVVENKKTGDGMMRQIGKVQELALQFGGGAGAFDTMASAYGVKLASSEIDGIVKAWRSAHPRIKRFWYELEDCLRWAIRRRGTTHEVGNVRVTCTDDGWLKVRLPSGRYLSYPEAEIDEDGRVSYMGTNQYTKKWERIETYGGKCFENLVQASARDVFLHGYRLAVERGYSVVLQVHDELVCEVPDTDEYTAEGLSALMSTNPSWAIGLPLAAAGHECVRYCKE